MLTRMVVLLAVGILVLPLSAQTTAPSTARATVVEATTPHAETAPAAPAEAAAPGTVTGTVTGNNVYVRSGPSTSGAYFCTKLHKPATVTVLEVKGEWLRIQPPPGCFSVISKEYVDLDSTGKVGTVKADNVYTRVGGDLCTWNSWKEFWGYHPKLKKDAKVQVIGTGGDFYKIVPPPGSFYWINAGFVDLGGKTPAKATPKEGDPSVKIETGETPTGHSTTEIVARPPTETTEPVVDNSTARGQFRLVEKEMREEYAKPVDQRDLKAIIAKYQGVKIEKDDFLKRAIASRVKYIQGQLDSLKEVKEVEDVVRVQKERHDKLMAEIAANAVKAQTTVRPKSYEADGVLTASGLFPGNDVTPKRYVVRDPDNSRIMAYVQCTTGDVKLDNYVGKHVGISGSTQYDRDLKLFIVEAKEVTVLKADAKLPVPPQPTVKPAPTEPEEPVSPKTPEEEPATKPAKEVPAKTPETKPAVTEPEETPAAEPEPATKPAAKPTTKPATKPAEEGDAHPTMGESEDPVPPDSMPKGKPTTEPATEPATAPAKEPAEPTTKPAEKSEPLPPTGLKTADDDK